MSDFIDLTAADSVYSISPIPGKEGFIFGAASLSQLANVHWRWDGAGINKLPSYKF